MYQQSRRSHNTYSPTRQLICATLATFSIGLASSEVIRPDALVAQVTDHVLAYIDRKRAYAEDEPEEFYDEVEHLIEPAIDFYSFARGVMGDWGSSEYFKSLTSDEQRDEFKIRVQRFTIIFRRALVATYSDALIGYKGEKTEVLSLADDDLDDGRAYVVQKIYVAASEPRVVRYLMVRDRRGDWRARNIIINDVNLGMVYRNQFAAAIIKHQGDIDRAIDNWGLRKKSIR